MSKILIIAEHDGSRLNQATAKCVTCASAVAGAEITVAVFAAEGAAVAAQAAQLAGVARVLRIDHPANAQPVAATLAPQLHPARTDHAAGGVALKEARPGLCPGPAGDLRSLDPHQLFRLRRGGAARVSPPPRRPLPAEGGKVEGSGA